MFQKENQKMTPDNLWVTMANPYLKAVKHNEASKEAKKNKKPIWIGPKSFSYNRVPKKVLDNSNREVNNRNLATLNMLNWFTHNSYLEIPISQRMALYFDPKAVHTVSDTIGGIGEGMKGIAGMGIIGGVVGGHVLRSTWFCIRRNSSRSTF